jgi:hypothetical protein
MTDRHGILAPWANALPSNPSIEPTAPSGAAAHVERYASHYAKGKIVQWDIHNTSGGVVPAADTAATHGVRDILVVE